jgi:ubiquinone/menaquinone biosynthesis C-methylase UbiE
VTADVWSDRADAYRTSATHRAGADLDLLVELAEPAPGVTALDVATGGGHVARRLREAGCTVVSSDPAPGMQPDVICHAEHLPFDDASFDVVTCRIAPHHFEDIGAAVAEMARVARDRVVIEDNTFVDDASEEADRLRDPSHVRNYTEEEWVQLLEGAGLAVERIDRFVKRLPMQRWLANVRCEGETAERVRELVAHRIDEEDRLELPAIVLKARKRR